MNQFNPHDWLPENRKQNPSAKPISPTGSNTDAVEAALQAIEAQAIDITSTYLEWLETGFALADEFGEGGREYFHRVSRFHPEYNRRECDEKYSNILKSKGGGIGIGTFFHHVKKSTEFRVPKQAATTHVPKDPNLQSGVRAEDAEGTQRTQWEGFEPTSRVPKTFDGSPEPEEEEEKETMPVFPEALYSELPQFLQRVVAPAASPEERDLLLLGALGAISACLPNLYGIYHGRKVFANFYLFVTAPASAGKGRLGLCKQLVLPIHRKLREQAKVLKLQYTNELAEYNQSQKDKEKPGKPPERMLFIPANNSSTGAFQLISDNQGRGLIFETEGDTLANSFKTDYGNYSDGFRNAFHHDPISYYRRTDREYVEIEAPCLSTVLSGTPKQVTTLIPNAENGLFSRFLFYYMNMKSEFQNVFANNDPEGMDAYFLKLGKEFLELYETLSHLPLMCFNFREEQQEHFVHYFKNLENRYQHLQAPEFTASVRRLGLNAFRMAMILTALRIMEDGEISAELHCSQADYDSVISLSGVLVKHSSAIFNQLPEEVKLEKRSNLKERFLEALPYEFTTRDYNVIAGRLKIPEKTAKGYITQFVKKKIIHREMNGRYLNPAKTETISAADTGPI